MSCGESCSCQRVCSSSLSESTFAAPRPRFRPDTKPFCANARRFAQPKCASAATTNTHISKRAPHHRGKLHNACFTVNLTFEISLAKSQFVKSHLPPSANSLGLVSPSDGGEKPATGTRRGPKTETPEPSRCVPCRVATTPTSLEPSHDPSRVCSPCLCPTFKCSHRPCFLASAARTVS